MDYDVTVIGAGVVGLAIARKLSEIYSSLLILDKEESFGRGISSRNSEVIHSGIYYKPGSFKALNCRRGINLLLEFCNQHNIPYDMCGKVIVATSKDELSTLDLLHQCGEGNGIKGIKKLLPDELREYEPHATGLSALYCPETGITFQREHR